MEGDATESEPKIRLTNGMLVIGKKAIIRYQNNLWDLYRSSLTKLRPFSGNVIRKNCGKEKPDHR